MQTEINNVSDVNCCPNENSAVDISIEKSCSIQDREQANTCCVSVIQNSDIPTINTIKKKKKKKKNNKVTARDADSKRTQQLQDDSSISPSLTPKIDKT